MSYVLQLVRRARISPEDEPRARAEVVAHFKDRAGYRVDGDVAHYLNEDTGVAFLFRLGNHAGGGGGGVALEVKLLRPHIFGLEAEREAQALVARFGFDVHEQDQERPREGAEQQGPYSSDGMLRGYAIANTAAHAVLGDPAAAGASLVKDTFVLPSAVLTSVWRWNVERAKLQRALGEAVFVPKVICVAPPPGTTAATAVVWTRFMPALLPFVDIYILVTTTIGPVWIERANAAFAAIFEALPVVRSAEETGIVHYDAREAIALAPQILALTTLHKGDPPRVIPMEKVLSKEIAIGRAGGGSIPRPAAAATAAAGAPVDVAQAEAEWAALKKELAQRFDAGDVRGALVVARRAADTFAGSTEPSVRAFARMALMTLAEDGVRNGDLDDAERAAKELVALAKRDASEHHATHANYQLGLIALARETPADGIDPFRLAADGFANEMGPVAPHTVIARVNHGLALLQAERFSEAAGVLQAIVDMTRDVSDPDVRKQVVPALHNLGLALMRAGFPAKALPFLDEALAARQRQVGADDPLYVDTLLVKANALIDLGKLDEAAELVRRGGGVAFNGGGEGHHLFAEAVFTEARRVSKLGDGLRADALARRALRLTELDCGVDSFTYKDRSTRADRLRSTWRASTRLADPGGARQLCVVTVGHTLRRWAPQMLAFDDSGTRPKIWYIDAPAPWAEAVRHLRDAVRLLFASSNDQLGASEPADANYLDVVDVDVRAIGVDELSQIEWERAWRDRVWEPSGAYVATVAGLRPITFTELGVIATARLLLAKRITPDEATFALTTRFKLDDATAADVVAAPIDAEARVVRPE